MNGEFEATLPTFGGSMNGLNMTDDGLGNMNMGMNLDLNEYMQGQGMDIGNGHHFARSPEWFYDLNGWAASGNYGVGYNGFTP